MQQLRRRTRTIVITNHLSDVVAIVYRTRLYFYMASETECRMGLPIVRWVHQHGDLRTSGQRSCSQRECRPRSNWISRCLGACFRPLFVRAPGAMYQSNVGDRKSSSSGSCESMGTNTALAAERNAPPLVPLALAPPSRPDLVPHSKPPLKPGSLPPPPVQISWPLQPVYRTLP